MRPNTTWLVRKCFFIAILFVFTLCNLHIKGKLNWNGSSLSDDEVRKPAENDEKSGIVTKLSYEHFVGRKLLQYNGWTLINKTAERIKAKQNENRNKNQKEAQQKLESSIMTTTIQSNISKVPSSNSGQKYKSSSNSGQYKIEKEKSTIKPTRSPVLISLLEAKKNSCTPPAYNEFPPDLFGNRIRARGAIIVHIAVVLYMFYCLAIVCEKYFLPSLEECAQRLNLSQDVAGATFMAAGSSAPELFTSILGVFIAKGDVGTGTIVGSAVFNILFVIGLCSLYTVSTELNWWPVARDSTYYTFTVLMLILCIYDGEVTKFESFFLLLCYGGYILIMNYNTILKEFVFAQWQTRFNGTFKNTNQNQDEKFDELGNLNNSAIVASHYDSFKLGRNSDLENANTLNPFIIRTPKISMFEAANRIIVMHKTEFRPLTRFWAAANLVMIRIAKNKATGKVFTHQLSRLLSVESRHFSQNFEPENQFWLNLPDWSRDGLQACLKWALMAPLHAALFYTIPDVKEKSSLFLLTFFASITWTAIFSYIMVWMVTLIGFTFGIPDSIMGITFLAAGTSVPDAYASIHVAKLGQADMAVSNSIGSNVFDILVGLAFPWFVETTIVEPGTVSTINSQGLVYAVILLFLSLVVTITLFHIHKWTLNPKLGKMMLGTYAIFIIISSALEFNLFGYVNPPMCPQ